MSNGYINEIEYARFVLNSLYKDNPKLVEQYRVEIDQKRWFIYDAVAFGELRLSSFGAENIVADRIAIEIKNTRTLNDSTIRSFIHLAEEQGFDAVVFIFNGKPRESYYDYNSDKIQICFIPAEGKNNEYNRAAKNKVGVDPALLIDEYTLSRLKEAKNDLAFAIGAGCSRGSHISDWKTLSKALGYELLYKIVANAAESMYRSKVITDRLNDGVFECFDSTSALDAIYRCVYESDYESESKINYWKAIKRVLYMEYDAEKKDNKLMEAISNCIERNHVKEVINYNFDSVLEQYMNSAYKSTVKEVEQSQVTIKECTISHVHGYIPYDYRGKETVGNFVFIDTEYYDNMMERENFTNSVQKRILESKNVIFVGFSFTDTNVKEILRERHNNSEPSQNSIFAFRKLPTFDFEGTNNALIEKRYKDLFEKYFGSLGVIVVWVKDFNDIPKIINMI